jgi:hypothetical protein
MDPIIAWAVAFMIAVAPPGRPGSKEAPDDGAARYREIAAAAARVAYDPEATPLFGGSMGRARTLALLLSVANYESGFLRHVDFGIGSRARGDSGQSWCLMQIKVGTGRTAEGWTGRDLVADRERCFRAGLAIMRRSFQACRNNSPTEMLDAYTSGSCDRGQMESRRRVEGAMKWMAQHAAPAEPQLQIQAPWETSAASTMPPEKPKDLGDRKLARE